MVSSSLLPRCRRFNIVVLALTAAFAKSRKLSPIPRPAFWFIDALVSINSTINMVVDHLQALHESRAGAGASKKGWSCVRMCEPVLK